MSPDQTSQQTDPVVDIDIVSDIMCPWCIVGFRQLEQALAATHMGARIRWHPFELNPQMPPEGQNLGDHIAEKYGQTAAQSEQNRAHLKALGDTLGIDFAFDEDSRIVNSFQAHQLLEFALSQGLQQPLKLALFDAHFSQAQDVSDAETLVEIAHSVGLKRTEAQKVLSCGSLAASVREKQAFWTSRGISGVPSMVFDGKYLVTGAQGADTYAQLLRKVAEEEAA
ncbi:MAG: DsbA family oxidoreductase [Pseudomonadota bacterium]